MNFLEFYGLKEDPFKLSPDPSYFYPTACHRVASDSLDYAVEHKEGFCLVYGEPGTGKTTVLKVFMDKWKDRAEIALILTPRLSAEEFLMAVLDELNIESQGVGKVHLLKAFRDFLLDKSSVKRPVVIIVDEAQNMPDETLEELRLLSNFETEKEKLLQIILVGQPEIEQKLKKENLKQLDQRIMVRARLKPLNHDEIVGYINHRLIMAGKGHLKLDGRIVNLVFKFSQGIPRLINVIASRTLMSAYLEGQNTVTPKHVKYAMDHLDGSEREGTLGRRTIALYASVIGAAFALTLLIGYMLMPSNDEEAARAASAGAPPSVSAGAGPSDPPAELPVHIKGKTEKRRAD